MLAAFHLVKNAKRFGGRAVPEGGVFPGFGERAPSRGQLIRVLAVDVSVAALHQIFRNYGPELDSLIEIR